MGCFVYIIQSQSDGSFYIGCSADPVERLRKHNAPHKGYTARKRPWKIVYTEELSDKASALKREAFLKAQKSRDFLLRLISESSVG
jgi:putative endonuclease